ncbi:MAG: futalosine hydrolase, partial [Chitinophagaceae bacterium]
TSHILRSKPGLMIQAGIAGSFADSLGPGSVVLVEEEMMGDLGVVEKGEFKDVFDMQFLHRNQHPFSEGSLKNHGISRWANLNLRQVKGLTVNEVSTDLTRIMQLKNKYFCDIESMEGAAFHYACLAESIPFLQIRSISNFVGERDKNKWQLRRSIDELNALLLQFIKNQTL